MKEDLEVNLQPGAQLAMIRDLQRRQTWLERQYRMLLTALHFEEQHPGVRKIPVCVDSRCGWGPVPHMAEQPGLCPWLKHSDPREVAEPCSST